ncbi:LexA family transcriptional regulator [Neptunomonas qingdaonensis]|uniref:Helix-turn-helix n=1 Tax=Neptunomonas qingdaonensis TaxID=1045558 RepID=A0A1I2N574_9GAMM|nr:helix-turn-helix domain-containing protein [Neptunomonas qingdaonensis]SFF97989.1 Helix-turn-helix [Neptunomonas qingdaonensis]
MDKFSDRLNKRMRELNLNQAAIYRRIGVSRGTISGWVNGTMCHPKGNNLEKLAKVLKCSVKWLAFGDDDDQPGGDIKPGDDNFALVDSFNNNSGYPVHQLIIDQSGVAANAIKVFSVSGDTMADTLQNSDTILIHTAANTPLSGNLYALMLGDEIVKSVSYDN